MSLSLKSVLTLCRRVFISLILLAIIAAASAWFLLPDIQRLRPHIESLLKQELQLSELSLGKLSWYWAGHIGFKAEKSSFKTPNDILAIHDTAITVSISILGILRGELWPERVYLHHGKLQLHVPQQAISSTSILPPLRLIVDDMDVDWRYADYQGNLNHVSFDLNVPKQRGSLHMPGFHLDTSLNAQGLPIGAQWHFENVTWLPAEWQKFVHGNVTGEAKLQQIKQGEWALDVHSQGAGALIDFPTGPFQLPFDSMDISSNITFQKDARLKELEITELSWQQGLNQATGTARWKAQKFSLNANSKHLNMPLLWSWLRPIDNTAAWQNWLANMHTGTASEIQVELNLPWLSPLQALPVQKSWDAMRYRIRANIDDADIDLGFKQQILLHTQASVNLDEHGLHADIAHTTLPKNIGIAQATVSMPWDTLILDIQGHGNVDVGRLHTHVAKGDATTLHWGNAPALAKFSMQWSPQEDLPKYARLSLSPNKEPWLINPQSLHLKLTEGEVIWDINHGLEGKKLFIQGDLFKGDLSFHAKPKVNSGWQLDALQGSASADFAHLVQHFNIPLAKPTGHIETHVSFNQHWHGNLDLGQAGWKNLLGSQKPIGQAMDINYQGDVVANQLVLSKLFSDNPLLQLNGRAVVSNQGLKLNFKKLKSPAFDGALSVSAPFGSDPWEMNVDASYLNRSALPDTLPNAATLMAKPWSLNASIKTFEWDDAKIHDAIIKLASKRNSAGIFKAKTIHSGTLHLHDISALFALPGEGAIDLRQLSASMDEQKLTLSASLKPEIGGGMHWRGFAHVNGNFGKMMHDAELTAVFANGDMQALFLGEGILLRDQAWWDGLRGRLRLRVDNGTFLKGGTLTKTLAAISLSDLPALFFGERKDLTQGGLYYKRLQIEATLHDQMFNIQKLGLRASAMDMAGDGTLNLNDNYIDLKMTVRPFQNIDAILAKIPLLRDMIGGQAHSIIRKIYHMHGPISNAVVDSISAEEAGLAEPGFIENLLTLPDRWFGKNRILIPVTP